jgi:hypothetical protein
MVFLQFIEMVPWFLTAVPGATSCAQSITENWWQIDKYKLIGLARGGHAKYHDLYVRFMSCIYMDLTIRQNISPTRDSSVFLPLICW